MKFVVRPFTDVFVPIEVCNGTEAIMRTQTLVRRTRFQSGTLTSFPSSTASIRQIVTVSFRRNSALSSNPNRAEGLIDGQPKRDHLTGL